MKNKEKSSFIFWLILAIFVVTVGTITKNDYKDLSIEKVDQELLDETNALLEELQEI